MNVLVVGFGNMGCRHAQSFLGNKENKIFVIELNDEIYINNCLRIGAKEGDIERIGFEGLAVRNIDFAVIATSAETRFKLFKMVLEAEIKNILLEKVVFQSVSQFDEALELIGKYKANVHCNFLNRYSDSYNTIKKGLSGGAILNIAVTGGHFGFACNGLHYVDLFKYLTGAEVFLETSNLVKSDNPNVRGAKYVEVFGQQIWKTQKGDQLFISSDKENNSGKGSENHFVFGNSLHIINENTLNQFNIENGKLDIVKFDMPMASRLTKSLYQQMKDGSILLPTIQETKNYHILFFESINNSLGISNSEPCPIT